MPVEKGSGRERRKVYLPPVGACKPSGLAPQHPSCIRQILTPSPPPRSEGMKLQSGTFSIGPRRQQVLQGIPKPPFSLDVPGGQRHHHDSCSPLKNRETILMLIAPLNPETSYSRLRAVAWWRTPAPFQPPPMSFITERLRAPPSSMGAPQFTLPFECFMKKS